MNKLTFEDLKEEAGKKKSTLILCHKNPDPDTLGSAFSLKSILEYFGSSVDVCCSDNPPEKFGFITGGADLKYSEKEYGRIIAVDVASPSQLGDLEFLAEKTDIIIDHHEMCTRFAPYYEDLCSACCEIIFCFAEYMNLLDKLSKHFFECIYSGITADTGGFKYSNVTKRTHEIAAKLMTTGIDHAEINRILFDSKTEGELVAERVTLENMKLYNNNRLSVILFTNKMKEENNVSENDISDIVNIVRTIDGVLVAVSIKQSNKTDNKYFISSRANCNINVAKACSKFGGGGHPRAAGGSLIAGSAEEALSKVVSVFNESINEYPG